jgi:hypothetical protein
MIRLNVQFHHLTSHTSTKNLYAVVNFLFYHPIQYTKSILRYPNHVILAMPYSM